MSWDLYRNQMDGPRVIDKPGGSLLRSGKLSINAAAIEFISNWKYTKLYFDSETNCIGLKYSENPTDHRVCFRLNRKGACVFIKGFVKYYNIDISKSIKCLAAYDDSKKFLVMRLMIGKQVENGSK